MRGELDNTIIVYASDHGEKLGDFNLFGECRPERGSVHIPLIVAGPGIQARKTAYALIELQDLAATSVDFAGLTPDKMPDSLPLKPLMEGQTDKVRDYQISALGKYKNFSVGWSLLANERYKLILDTDRTARLYDLSIDPWENHDIAKQEPFLVYKMTERLEQECPIY